MQDQKIPIQPTPIQQLSVQVANQIAAGEVVERPASVVKELVENSLDAGASQVDVDIEQAGSKLILVRDDGCGVRPQDLELALSRHATSKLTSAEELGRITSLGFRGEALASIGSIARLEMVSRPRGGDAAWSVRGDAGNASGLSEPTPASHPPGTSVRVADLFHNVPARRRFLRAERTEFLHIEQLLRGLALSRFDVGFNLTHNQRSVFRASAAHDARACEQRVLRLCGRTFLRQSLRVDYAAGGLRLGGWLARPTFSRSQRDLQFLFINGRFVRDRLIGHALRQAYGTWLPSGRHPGYVLHLEIDPALVDVNVHPTKHEVRFRDTRLVHDFLSHCIDNTLHTLQPESAAENTAQITAIGTGVRDTVSQIAETSAVYPGPLPAVAGVISQGGGVSQPKSSPKHDLQLVQLHGRFLLATQGADTVLVDLYTARAWLAAQELSSMLENGEVVVQPLLIPARVELGKAAVDSLETRAAEVAHLGFDLSLCAARCVLVRRIPAVLGEVNLRSLINGLAQVVAAMLPGSTPTAEQAQALVAACRFDTAPQMSRAELESIWRSLKRRQQDGPLPRGLTVTLNTARLVDLLQS